jgi:hypothetical protein
MRQFMELGGQTREVELELAGVISRMVEAS